MLGQGRPSIRLTALVPVKGVEVRLDGCTGARSVRLGPMKAGAFKDVVLDHPAGHCTWKVELVAAGATEPETFDFETVIGRPMEIRIGRDTVDLGDGKLSFAATEPVARVTLKVLGEAGRVLSDQEYAPKTPANGTTSLVFAPPSEPVTLVKVTAYDPDGFFNGVEISPFFIEIPHEEVAFDFGKADIPASEEGKLSTTLASVREALHKFGREFQARLYVAGYTDTVGGREYNQDLSDRRALSIARWFTAHGLEVRTCYQGFGEDALAVQTADETPEPRNRRTLHVLANQPPPVSGTFPRAAWKCL
jgi:outer membrane protein OmpA-like peptidoglycan-associated protein